jgi:adenylate cyclase
MVNPTDILNGKILIVDDKRPMVILLERILRSAGYTSVSTATDPKVVEAMHQKNNFDLILLDLVMPDMDGYQVLQALLKVETEDYPPVIVITAHPSQQLQAFQAGARDFIRKPFELSEVLARVRNMLEVRLLQLETKRRIQSLEQRLKVAESNAVQPER